MGSSRNLLTQDPSCHRDRHTQASIRQALALVAAAAPPPPQPGRRCRLPQGGHQEGGEVVEGEAEKDAHVATHLGGLNEDRW